MWVTFDKVFFCFVLCFIGVWGTCTRPRLMLYLFSLLPFHFCFYLDSSTIRNHNVILYCPTLLLTPFFSQRTGSSKLCLSSPLCYFSLLTTRLPFIALPSLFLTCINYKKSKYYITILLYLETREQVNNVIFNKNKTDVSKVFAMV